MDEEKIPLGLTFDDVLLKPQYSKVKSRKEVKVDTFLTKDIKLSIPIISASMDSVTESDMAIAMAQLGGLGVIHRFIPPEVQASEVRKVKRSETSIIENPITIFPDSSLRQTKTIGKENNISGLLVVNKNNKLLGIITKRDIAYQPKEYDKKPVKDFMTKKLITAKPGITLEKAKAILNKHKIEKLPIVDDKYRLIGLITYKDITKTKDRPTASKDIKGRLRVAGAVGIASDTLKRAEALIASDVDAIVIDTAHGHTKGVIGILKDIKKSFPDMDVIAGNIGTSEAAKDLVDAGADGVKVGIGPGSICTTRIIAGVGIPQLSAIYNVASAIEGSGVPVIADGGIRYSGDIVKAIAVGANSIMTGSLFAGCEESPGETIIYSGRKFKTYRGMGSIQAMQQGSKDRYFQDVEDDIKKLVPEGIEARVPFKGNLSEIFFQLSGGIRAGMGYCGAKNIEELQKAKFIRITNPGMMESHTHDVTITREAPNYSR